MNTADDARCWYLPGPGNQPTGPFTAAQVVELYGQGRLAEASLCWREGMPQWLPLSQVAPFAGCIRASSPPSFSAAVDWVARRRRSAQPRFTAYLVTVVVAVVCLGGLGYTIYLLTHGAGTSLKFGFGGSSSNDSQGIPIYSTGLLFGLSPFRSDSKTAAVGIDREAGLLALKTWNLTKGDDSYFMHITIDWKSKPGEFLYLPPLLPRDCFHELRNPSVVVASQNMSEADRLNGRNFYGKVELKAEVGRRYPTSKDWAGNWSGKWDAWESGAIDSVAVITIELEQRNGVWKILKIGEFGQPDYYGRTITFRTIDPLHMPN